MSSIPCLQQRRQNCRSRLSISRIRGSSSSVTSSSSSRTFSTRSRRWSRKFRVTYCVHTTGTQYVLHRCGLNHPQMTSRAASKNKGDKRNCDTYTHARRRVRMRNFQFFRIRSVCITNCSLIQSSYFFQKQNTQQTVHEKEICGKTFRRISVKFQLSW